jgi:hypothetical protein
LPFFFPFFCLLFFFFRPSWNSLVVSLIHLFDLWVLCCSRFSFANFKVSWFFSLLCRCNSSRFYITFFLLSWVLYFLSCDFFFAFVFLQCLLPWKIYVMRVFRILFLSLEGHLTYINFST